MSTSVVIEGLQPNERQVPGLYYCDMQIVPHLALWSRESAGYYLQGFTPREGDTRYRDLTSAPFADIWDMAQLNKDIAATCIACESSPCESMSPLEWLADADARNMNVAGAMRAALGRITARALEIRVEKAKQEISAEVELAQHRDAKLGKLQDVSAKPWHSEELIELIAAAERHWSRADWTDNSTFPTNATIENDLKAKGFSVNRAKVGASIIRPKAARG